nr:ulp1 protease family, C-terminal catalytic domain-containing protein [Tanacetum cinerariifolium]
MQTLAPQLKVESNVIDTFSIVLNREQKMNSKGKKIKYFFHTLMIVNMFKRKKSNGQYDEEKQFEAFSKTIKSEFKKDPEMKNMKDLEMVFIPIISHEHYYLVVFNFLKGNTVIIDNSKTQMTYDAKYKTVCELLKKMFSMHLEKVEHPRAKDVLNKKPKILRPKWGTKENDTDYGIFLMMHMEYYNEETAKNWNLEFLTKKEGNAFFIIKMRGMWYSGEPLWGCSELGGYLVVEGLLRIASLSHATYPERKCFPNGILV